MFRENRIITIMLIICLSTVILIGCESNKENSGSNEFPKKPVEVIVGFGAGGETDTAARLIFQYAEKYFDQSFAVINKPGASGEIAWAEVAKANPDGYTIAFINPPTFASHPAQRDNCSYQIDDFEIIANMVTDPAAFIVKADSDINSIDELYEKARVEEVSIGYSGPGTSEDITLNEIEEIKGIKLDRIPYDGSAPSVVALLGGHIDAAILNVSGALTHINDDSVKVIAVAGDTRSPEVPDVPTLEEEGMKVYNTAYRGLAAPKGVPKENLDKIVDAVDKALKDEEFKKRAEEIGLPIDYKNGEEFTKIIERLYEQIKLDTEKIN